MKSYIKPELRYEDFGLSMSVATCSNVISQDNHDNCTNVITGLPSTAPVANMYTGNTTDGTNTDSTVETYCYTNASADMAVFHS